MLFRIHKSADRIVDFKGDRVPKVSKYFALGRRRISNAPLFMQIAAPASVGAVRKIISYVSFSAGPSLDTENTLLALGQDKAMHRGVAIASYPFPFLLFSSFFHLSKNFLIFFIYPSKEILRTRFVASFRFVLSFLFCRDNGAVGNLASLFCNLRKQPFAARVLGTFSLQGGKEYGWTKVSLIEKRSFINFYEVNRLYNFPGCSKMFFLRFSITFVQI